MKKSEVKGNWQISSGTPYPFGAVVLEGGINFSIMIREVEKVTLCLFDENRQETPFAEIELDPLLHKTGAVWHARVQGLSPFVLYAYRVVDKVSKQSSNFLLDPYARSVASRPVWGSRREEPYRPLGKVIPSSTFDWQGDRFPKIPFKHLVIYEMHVRGFTCDTSSQVEHPGTYLGIIEKIPYLKELGVNAVELMPIHEFNEMETAQIHPKTHEKLFNYFGYSTVNFFSPMGRYASRSTQDQAVNEFKTMVRELHKHGIEVILDVVYNHTCEGDQTGPTLSFRGFDSRGYYMVDEKGNYLNFSGCGNTFNANHHPTRELILDSLRYWVSEMHVDGFRFDLASIFSRDENGAPLGSHAPVIEAISADPLLADTKLIAEAWDAGGLYQVGGFYPGNRWSEWNGRYRDVVRRFIKGTPGQKAAFATALCGSQDLYGWGRAPTCSINFVTAHDGFSLADLVAYNEKHNEDNGENNRDGFDHNDSWNCGVEGDSHNKKIIYLRERQMRNFHLVLMVSQGVPMILMGDEYAHTRHGNNNTWCQDNGFNWFLWDRLREKTGFYRFFCSLIQFRNAHPELGRDHFLKEQDITWHGLMPGLPDWDNDNGFIAFTLNSDAGSDLYVAFNASHLVQTANIPPAGKGKRWHWVVNTHNPPPEDFFDEENRMPLVGHTHRLSSYSAILLYAI